MCFFTDKGPVVNINKFLNIVIILGCVVIGFFFYQAKVDNDQTLHAAQRVVDQSSVKPPMDPQDLANKYLQQAQNNLAAEKLKAEINIKKAIAESQNPSQPRVVETDPSKIPVEQQIWKDPQVQVRQEKPLDQRYSEDQGAKNPEIDKQEYIRQFKENARKNGYEITVNDDLEVTSVTPIRKPQNTKNDYDSNRNQDSDF